MHFTGKISKIDYKRFEHLAEIRKQLRIQLRHAVADWLRAVIELVPVSTGMARASLKPIGDYAGVDVDVFSANTIGNSQIRKPSESRNPELGEEMGMKPAQAFTGNQYQYVFQYDIFIPHYHFNEFGSLSELHKKAGIHISYGYKYPQVIPPWQSIKAGKKAFQDYMKNNLKKAIPKMTSFIILTKISIDAGR